MSENTAGLSQKPNLIINIISVALPLAIVAMLAFPNKVALGEWTKVLPHVIGSVNSLTSLALIAGFILIKTGREGAHRIAMSTAFLLGIVFLFCYVAYHISNPANRFGEEGIARVIYLIILASHILLSMVVLPLVLRAMYFAVTGQISRHRKIVRFAYPIWLYVSVSGVAVYLMLYQIYG